ncbi:hypothetical protein CAL26_03155 [Bordetella genomosp. 9]|uniref:AB hydrolase-1 domain-containing protein n=1 Tax=Bordetella genomosp. 9 TaxID=1416803 RepID=A0A261RMQ6_9BORD|nr:alpha/beta hydrolase [Bordetella genomosp. 9]OZI26344.1 hypothetical protein CAL26_03155 [Bordetella genomosp. 9]
MSTHVDHASPRSQPASLAAYPIRTVIFIHGFLDSGASWQPLVHALAPYGLACLAPDLRGAGDRADQDGPYTLAQAVDDVLDRLREPAAAGGVALVGHSMGAQIAELAAMRAPASVSALALITPTPLEGNALPDEVRAMLRESGGDVAAQRGIRKAFSRNLPDALVDASLDPRRMMGAAAVRGYYDAFTGGDRAGERPGQYPGPTLILGAVEDPVIPSAMVERIRSTRHPRAELAFIDGSGHWPQLEQPASTAAHLARFLQLGAAAGK